MDTLQFQPALNDKTQWLMEKVTSVNYSKFLCKEDPTRIAINTGTNMHEYITSTSSLYNLCQQAYRENVVLPNGDFNLRQSGRIRYRENIYILAYYECPIQPRGGTIFNCPIPSNVSFTAKCHMNTTMIPVLIPLSQPYYLLHSPFSTACRNTNNALLCPGSFRFTIITTGDKKHLTAIYNAFDEQTFMYMSQDNNFYLSALSYGDTPLAPDEIVAYLIALHTRRTQRGYYAPIESAESYAFRQYGSNFNTSPSEKSYYEKMTSSSNIDESTLPFADYTMASYIKVYVQKCRLEQGKITKPLFANILPARDVEYNTPLLVDIRCIDLNFIWQEQHRKRDENMPTEGYYALSQEDNVYLQYYSHSPGVIVILAGYVKDDSVTLEQI